MRLLSPASEDDMVATFLAAEITSARYGQRITEILAQLGQPRSIIDQPDTRDQAANGVRRRVLAAYRDYPSGDVFTGMPADVRWHHATLTPAELGTVRYIDYPYGPIFPAGPGWPPTAPAASAPGSSTSPGRSTGRSPRTSGTGSCPRPSS